MEQQPSNRPPRKPIWSIQVDHVIEFTDKAIDDPAELAKSPGASRPERGLSVSADSVVEFTDRAQNVSPGTNGPTPETPP